MAAEVKSFWFEAGLNSMRSFREYNSRFLVRETIFTPTLAGGKSESAKNGSSCSFRKDEDATLRVLTGGAGFKGGETCPGTADQRGGSQEDGEHAEHGGLGIVKMAV